MGLLKYFRQDPGVGWYTKELSLAGFKHDGRDTKFILEVLSLINKSNLDNVIYDLDVIKNLYFSQPLTNLENPTYFNEYIVTNDHTWQSNRLGSLLSQDQGKTWYDINKLTFKMKIFRFIHKHIKKLDKKYLLYYVNFPYNPND